MGFLTIGYALYLRYMAVEFAQVRLECEAGLQTMLCKTRQTMTYLFKHYVFGVTALVIATLHVIRPSIVTLTAGLIAACFGIVLYNIGLSGVAIGLLILVLVTCARTRSARTDTSRRSRVTASWLALH